MLPVLYCHADSGYSYKVALALSLLGIDFEQRHIAIWKPREERSPEFRDVAAHGEVPVLLIDGHVLCQSNAILDYLARREQCLDGSNESQRLRVREWLSWEANRISLNLAHSRFGRRWGDYHPEVLAWYDRRSRDDLDRMEQAFAQSPFLAGDLPTIADVACCGYLFFLDEGIDGQGGGVRWAGAADIDLLHWPRVREWRERMTALPGFATPQALFAGHGEHW
ncbi:glutathione S-transferase family protein [Lysobacter tyrosinilyticus]